MKLLRERLKKIKSSDPNITIVKCYLCEMTMWSHSDNAFVDTYDRIICRTCKEENK